MHSEADSMQRICDEMLHFKTNSCFSVPAAGFHYFQSCREALV